MPTQQKAPSLSATVSAPLVRKPKRPTKSQEVQQLFRESNITTGSIVRRRDSPERLLIVSRVTSKVWWGRPITGGSLMRFATCLRSKGQPPILNMVLVFVPPDGWMHCYEVQPINIEERVDDRLDVRARLRAFISKRLATDEMQTLEYGVYWRKDAVERLRKEFDEAREL